MAILYSGLSTLLIILDNLFVKTILIVLFSYIIMRVWHYTSNKKHHSLKKRVYVQGLSSSFPKSQYSQTQMKDMFLQNYCSGRENVLKKDLDFIDRVFAGTSIKTCYVNLPEARLFEQMKREPYTVYVKEALLDLACQAARDVLSKSGVLPKQVTHLLFGTVTAAVQSPSLDIHIMCQLELNPTVKRLNVEYMGCLTGFRLAGLCRDIAAEDERNIVLLVVCDICSAIGNQLTPFVPMQPVDKSNIIDSAMFRDSGGAAIFSQKYRTDAALQILDHQTLFISNTLDKAVLQEFNNGAIHLYIDKTLPESIFPHVPEFMTKFLAEHSINVSQCLFALHTGGPKIIDGIQKCLNLEPEQLFATWFVMKKYGNLSGSSNLVVLDYIMRFRGGIDVDELKDICFPSDFSKYSHIVGLAFGPGLCVECVIFQI
jgi:predicted naringenin-chalcone synthase